MKAASEAGGAGRCAATADGSAPRGLAIRGAASSRPDDPGGERVRLTCNPAPRHYNPIAPMRAVHSLHRPAEPPLAGVGGLGAAWHRATHRAIVRVAGRAALGRGRRFRHRQPDLERAVVPRRRPGVEGGGGVRRRVYRRRPGSELLLYRADPAGDRLHRRHPARQPAAPPAVQGAVHLGAEPHGVRQPADGTAGRPTSLETWRDASLQRIVALHRRGQADPRRRPAAWIAGFTTPSPASACR